jgi:hypothetical protein
MKPLTLLQGCGVSVFVLFRLYGSSIAHPADLRMHTPVPLANFALSIIANVMLMGIAFTFFGQWIGNSRKLKWLRFVLPGALLALLIKVVGINIGAKTQPSLLIAVWLGVTLLAVLLRRKSQRGEQVVSNLTQALLLGMGIFFLIVVVQLARIAIWRPAPNHFDNLSAVTSDSTSHPRVVWILFDELSYQQTFGDRYPNLHLPNFDKLRESSTLFTDVRPVANFTELAIPSILVGKVIERVHYTPEDRLEVGSATGPLYPFDAAHTPFAEARERGFTTGVVGWYNPYCSMFAPYLDLCYWTNEEEIPLMFGVRDGFWKDLASPWMHYMEDAFSPARKRQLALRRVHTFRDLLQHSDQALKQPNLDFLLIHLPLPHPPGFYNRKTQQFDDSGSRSYIDNLALADKTLGQLMTVLQQSPRWKDTDVIVCGDHSWRTWLWSSTPSWTAEDAAVSHGELFDPRPMLMIHLAGQTTPATVSSPYPLLQVHDVLDDLAEGKKPSFSHP